MQQKLDDFSPRDATMPPKGSYMSSPARRDETHGNGAWKNLPAPEGPNDSTPPESASFMGAPSVGGGHENRALAHGYSILTPPWLRP
jgi:hypothetical protein